MNYQFASTYNLIIIMFLHALFLFLRFEKGNNSRLFLAIAFLLFGGLKLFQFINAYVWGNEEYINYSMITLFSIAFICSTTLAYALEVISPKSVTLWKIFKLNLPLNLLLGISLIALLNGYKFEYYSSITTLFSSLTRLDAIVFLLVLICVGVCLISTILLLSIYRHKQVNSRWVSKYLITFIVINLFYILSIVTNGGLHMLCKYIFVLCCTYITYLELFERADTDVIQENSDTDQSVDKEREVQSPRIKGLKIRLVEYMEQEKAWRDPDITVKDVTSRLSTNRRALNSAIQDLGYENFPSYVNYLRVKDFTEKIQDSKDDSFQNIFYIVGFKSRATAHRNFKNIKGLSPSEYYQSIQEETRL